MRHLVVLSVYPAHAPAASGGELRLLHLYTSLSRWFRIDLVSWTLADRPREAALLAPNFTNHRIPVPPGHQNAIGALNSQGITGALFNTAAAMLGRGDTEFHKLTRDLAAGADCVIHESPYTLLYDREFGGDAKPRIYNSHNFEADMARAYSRESQVWDFAFHLERRLALGATAVFATSDLDAAKFACFHGVAEEAVTICPNGFDAAAFPRRRPAAAGMHAAPLKATFLGSAHPPNRDAARFINDVLAPRFPHLRFTIAGGVCGLLDGPVPQNVTLIPKVDEAAKRSLFQTTDIFLNPVSTGSGTSIKTIEAMAAGLPIIATPTGARGLGATDGWQLAIADLAAFPAALSRLRDDADARHGMGAAASDWAHARFAWDKIADRVAGTIERVCASPGVPARAAAIELHLSGQPDMALPGAGEGERVHLGLTRDPILDIQRTPQGWRIAVPLNSEHRRMLDRDAAAGAEAEILLSAISSTRNDDLCRLFGWISARASNLVFHDVGLLPLLEMTRPLCPSTFQPRGALPDFVEGLGWHPDRDLLQGLAEALWEFGDEASSSRSHSEPWAETRRGRRILIVTDCLSEPIGCDFDDLAENLAVIGGAFIDLTILGGEALDAENMLAPAVGQIRWVSRDAAVEFVTSAGKDYELVLSDLSAVRAWADKARRPFALPPPREEGGVLLALNPADYLFRTEHDDLFHRIHQSDRPFLLVLGPKNAAANLPLILAAYRRAQCPRDGDLVFIGPGDEMLIPVAPGLHSYSWLDRAETLGALRRCRGVVAVREAGGVSEALEAWMSERAIVVQPGNRRLAALVEHGINGLVADDVDDLAAAMGLLLREPAEAARMGRQGRQSAMPFSWSQIVRRILRSDPV